MIEYSVGIDPGKNGAIAILHNGKFDRAMNIPLISTKEVDNKKLNFIFRDLRLLSDQTEKENNNKLIVFIEKVHAIFGAAAGATYEFGRINGLLEGFLAAYGLKYVQVPPKLWQKEVYAGIPEIRKPGHKAKRKGGGTTFVKGRLETKRMSAMAAARLFPNDDFRASDWCGNPHDGIVDAVLLAEYGNRKYVA